MLGLRIFEDSTSISLVTSQTTLTTVRFSRQYSGTRSDIGSWLAMSLVRIRIVIYNIHRHVRGERKGVNTSQVQRSWDSAVLLI